MVSRPILYFYGSFLAKFPGIFPETSSVRCAAQGMNLVAIDTMHLFPTTLECAKLVEAGGADSPIVQSGAVYDTAEFAGKCLQFPMENHHLNRQINYFNGPFSIATLVDQRLNLPLDHDVAADHLVIKHS